MYCSKCGRRLDNSAVKCPECGTEANPAYCGGFWDLTNSAPKQVEQRRPDHAEVAGFADNRELNLALEESAGYKRAAEKWEKKYNGASKIYRIIALVLVVLLLSLLLYACSNKKKLTDLEKNTVSVEEYNSMKGEKVRLEKENKELQAELDKLTGSESDTDTSDDADAETGADTDSDQSQGDWDYNASPQSGDNSSPAQGTPRNQSSDLPIGDDEEVY